MRPPRSASAVAPSPNAREPDYLIGKEGELLFVLVKSVAPPKAMDGPALLASFDRTFLAEFAAALERQL